MNSFSHVPPGFRFHPTDEELVDYYLRKKIASKRIDLDVIKDVDLYRIEPWDLQDLCRIGTEEQNDYYFFSHKDKKYPTGTRTNRATKAGFWKATGRDKAIYARHSLIGMRKTLVFYKGRAPNGLKSDWIMHEYRLETNENATSQEEGWVVCRVFKKRITTVRKMEDYGSPCWFDDHQVGFMPEIDSPRRIIPQPISFASFQHNNFPCKQELELQYNVPHDHLNFLNLPQLESPRITTTQSVAAPASCNSVVIPNYASYNHNHNHNESNTLKSLTFVPEERMNEKNNVRFDQMTTDWRVVDQLVASQLSHEDASKETNFMNEASDSFQVGTEEMTLLLMNDDSKRIHEIASEYASTSTSTSSCQIDMWK